MSRVGKNPVTLPQGVTVEVHGAIEVEEHGPEVGDRGELAELRHVDLAGAAHTVLVLLPSSGNTELWGIMPRWRSTSSHRDS